MCNTAHEQLLLDIETQELKKSFHSRTYMGGADWSPDGAILARAADSESVMLHNAQSYQPLARLLIGRKGGIRTLHFSPDGRFLYAASKIPTTSLGSSFDPARVSETRARLVNGRPQSYSTCAIFKFSTCPLAWHCVLRADIFAVIQREFRA